MSITGQDLELAELRGELVKILLDYSASRAALDISARTAACPVSISGTAAEGVNQLVISPKQPTFFQYFVMLPGRGRGA